MASLGELFISLGFDVDDAKLKKFKSDLRDTHEEMVKLGTVAGGTLAALSVLVNKSADGAVRLNNMAASWGANAQAAQTFANALHQVNSQISISAGQDKYRAFSEMINAKVPVGSGAYAALSLLGVKNPYGTPEQALGDIRGFVSTHMGSFGTTPEKQRARVSDLLGQIGLSDSIGAILEPDEKYNGASQYNIKQGVLDNLSKFAAATAEFDEALNKFSTDMSGEIGEKLVKVVEFLTKALNFADKFNTDHPGAATAEGIAEGAAGTLGGWAILKKLFGGGAGAAGAASGAGMGAMRTLGVFGAGIGIAEGAWWLTGKEVEGAKAVAAWIKGGGTPGASTRGINNNNPGNIKYGPFARFHGATGADNRGFAIFPSYEMGAASIGALLKSYGHRGIDSIHDIVGHYTSGDPKNVQDSYEKMLRGMTGASSTDHLNLSDPVTLTKLVNGIIRQENGGKAAGVTINLHSNSKDNKELAHMIEERLQRHINGAYSQTNVGADQ